MVRFILLIGLFFVSTASLADNEVDFSVWLTHFKLEALQNDISQETLDDAFQDIDEVDDRVLDLDIQQPEKKILFSEYLNRVVSTTKIHKAKEQYHKNHQLLAKIAKQFQVPSSIIVALWGIESNFGASQGKFNIIKSLASLAYEGRRSAFFKKELLSALTILENEDVTAQDMTGSWAGAMGQTQFMPSSYLQFAVDFDGDDKKDIWESDADALASIANYLHSKGWNPKLGWGYKVTLPEHADLNEWNAVSKKKEFRPLKEWRKMGVRYANGKTLLKKNSKARLIMPDSYPQVAYLVFSNYDVLLDWNRSIYFATTVGVLADAIVKGKL